MGTPTSTMCLCLISEALCCAGNMCCKCLCGAFSCCGMYQSVTTRLIYAIQLLLIMVVTWVISSAWLARELETNIPSFFLDYCYPDGDAPQAGSNVCYGNMVVY